MYKIILTLTGDPRSKTIPAPTLDTALAQFNETMAFYRGIKRRDSIPGNYQLTLSTNDNNIVKSEAV